jgi:hypothetical protein
VPGGATPRRYWPSGSPGAWRGRWGRVAARSSAMGRPGSPAVWVRRPPKAAPPSRRVRPPASIALDRGRPRTLA